MSPAMHNRGFTLIELLVAIAITSILIVFASQVLSHVSSATGQGAALSQIIQSGAVVSEQFKQDFEQIVGPEVGGVLMIVNYELPDIQFTEDDPDPTTLPANSPERNVYTRRLDQLLFIRFTGSGEQMTPANQNSFSSSNGAQFQRVWYGHVLRTDPNGIGPTPPSGTVVDFGTLGIPDQFAANWTLGRQALFLDETVSGGLQNYLDGNASYGAATYNADLKGGLNPPHPAQWQKAFMGFSDVAKTALFETPISPSPTDEFIAGDRAPGNGENPQQLFRRKAGGGPPGGGPPGGGPPGGGPPGGGPPGGGPPGGGPPGLQTFPPDQYALRAYDYLFVNQRLRYNPEPKIDFDDNGDPEPDSFYPWQIAQMHPMFIGNVVDFRVQFAGDYDNGALDDPVDGIDRYPTGGRQGEIVWYDLDQLPPTTPPNGFYQGTDTSAMDERPIMGDPPEITPTAQSKAFIFRHGPTAVDGRWPHLIRITYRIVDENARFVAADGAPGRVFEQILKVPH